MSKISGTPFINQPISNTTTVLPPVLEKYTPLQIIPRRLTANDKIAMGLKIVNGKSTTATIVAQHNIAPRTAQKYAKIVRDGGNLYECEGRPALIDHDGLERVARYMIRHPDLLAVDVKELVQVEYENSSRKRGRRDESHLLGEKGGDTQECGVARPLPKTSYRRYRLKIDKLVAELKGGAAAARVPSVFSSVSSSISTSISSDADASVVGATGGHGAAGAAAAAARVVGVKTSE